MWRIGFWTYFTSVVVVGDDAMVRTVLQLTLKCSARQGKIQKSAGPVRRRCFPSSNRSSGDSSPTGSARRSHASSCPWGRMRGVGAGGQCAKYFQWLPGKKKNSPKSCYIGLIIKWRLCQSIWLVAWHHRCWLCGAVWSCCSDTDHQEASTPFFWQHLCPRRNPAVA